MTIEIEIDNAKTMKTVIDALSIAHNEVHIKFEEKGFRAQTQSTGAYILSDVFLEKECFSKFNVTEEMTIHVDLSSFGSFIKMANNDDSLIISYDEEKEQLNLILKSENMIRKSSLRLLGDEDSFEEGNKSYKFLDILSREFHSNSTLSGTYLIEAIKVASFGEGVVNIIHSKKGIKLSVTSENYARTAEAEIIYTDDNSRDVVIFSGSTKNKRGVEVIVPEIHTANYDLESLKSIPRTIKSGEEVKFSMMNQGPLRIVTSLQDGKGHLAIALSPIILKDMS